VLRFSVRHPVAFSLALLTTAVQGAPAGSSFDTFLAYPAHPTTLDLDEEQSPALLAIACRFNPALALPIREVWPVEVGYAWHDGADLIGRVEESGGVREFVAVHNQELSRRDWSNLPTRTPRGDAIRYFIDAPGDDRRDPVSGRSNWRRRFAAIAQPDGDATSPTSSPYPPTQYVHAFWWNRAQGFLAIQYWFYYPYNEWVNRHEGDWERIQILLKGPQRIDPSARFTPVAHHYFFHEYWTAPASVSRFIGPDPEDDHPLVYVGGRGEWFGHAGTFSGGSYPQAGHYAQVGFSIPTFSPGDDTSLTVRFIPSSDFRLILLPEPHRLDARRFPELSWLKLPFYVGRRSGHRNPLGLERWLGRPPLQPAARIEWGGPPVVPRWRGRFIPAVTPSVVPAAIQGD
jgi:hypothetical protein